MKTYKISVLGDLMCEPPLFEGSKKKNGKFDFWPTFKPLKSLLDEADYVIGNLETPVAGEALGYTNCMVSFNAPYEYLEALKKLGVDLVSTANNHALDRGYEGLCNTIDALDKIGIAHTGTYKEWNDPNKVFYVTIGDTKIAVIATTYGTNDDLNGVKLDTNGRQIVNYHRLPGPKKPDKPSDSGNVPMTPELKKTRELIESLLGRKITWDENVMLKKAMGVRCDYPDQLFSQEAIDRGMPVIEKQIKEARKKADVVVLIPHSGGQFNTIPGARSVYTMNRFLNAGADSVLMGHSHTFQKAGIVKGANYFYSLGNVTMAPNSIYPEPDTLPEIGIIPHLYVGGGKIQKVGYSLYKICMDEKNKMTVVPLDELYESLGTAKEKHELAVLTKQILERITELPQDVKKPKREYVLK